MIRHIPFVPTLIATGFGCGFWPWGPGTMGALFATLLWMGASFWLDAVSLAWVTLAAAVVFPGLGTWATRKLQPFWGADPSRVGV
uniref:phosphatidylglycerophosphatase A n=1 Tax=Prevotella sp. TaxID=59823 RepID=UPI004025A48F